MEPNSPPTPKIRGKIGRNLSKALRNLLQHFLEGFNLVALNSNLLIELLQLFCAAGVRVLLI